MEWGQARTLLTSLFNRERRAALSRRDMLAGMRLAGLFVAAVKVIPPSAAEAATLAPVATPEALPRMRPSPKQPNTAPPKATRMAMPPISVRAAGGGDTGAAVTGVAASGSAGVIGAAVGAVAIGRTSVSRSVGRA
jgi:hypothetical protein